MSEAEALRSLPPDTPRSVTVLGCTGSIGASTIDLLRRDRQSYRVEALSAHRNVAELAALAKEFGARMAVIADPDLYAPLAEALAGTGIIPAAGPAALVEAADRPADWVMASIVGAAGLEPTLAAIRRGAVIGLANKECLVCAGDLVMAAVERHGATLLPVDSEHSAIFQVFDFAQIDKVERITLTASGGPFRTWRRDDMAGVTPEQAVAHPNWSMGAKISVDSATMFNKGLELVEAHHLFGLPEDRIDILVHPQSVIHSMVSYVDGSVLAQLGTPDMRTPIAFALGWPRRIPAPSPRLDLAQLGSLTFEAPDPERFPALRLVRRALQTGGAAPTIMNAANEVAVASFLDRRIGFLEIAAVVEEALETVEASALTSLEDVLQADAVARRRAREACARRA
ncbi:1-deoxy-D-xylulose-5-phosphate reductoisomerase [Novispirillum sp. DQ9]|uniref:1-deoxy-D-xylulose-5-phosphate reductoisomerase n=1 Tax=Novispirillum sp. DQ9 TaxID=3398612 RepID=UPI003C7D842E